MSRPAAVRRFILGGSFSSLLAIVIVKAMGFAESVFVARVIGADGFGLLTLVLSLTNIMIAVATLGVPPAVTKFLAGEVSTSSQASRSTVYMAVRLIAASSAAVCIAVGLVSYFLLAPYYSNPALLNMLILAVILVGLTAPLIPFANALQGLGKITQLNWVSVAGAAIGLVLAVVLAIALAERGALIAFFPSAMGIPLVPVLSSLNVSDPKRGRGLVPRAMRITAFVSVPIVVIVIIFAQEIIGVAYGPQFSGASPLLAILATSALIASITGVVGSQIAGSGQMWLGLEINLAWVTAVISSAAALIPRLGAVGASLAILTGYAVLGLILIIIGRRKLLLSFDGVTVPAAWSLAFVGIALVLQSFTGTIRIQAGVGVTLLCVVSIFVLLTGDERQLVREALVLLGLQSRSP